MSNTAQGVGLKFPADDEMLRGCYGNRPSCLAKDLPSEVGLTMKNRRKKKQKTKLSRIILTTMTSFDFEILTHLCSKPRCNALLIEITFSFYQISYMMDRAGELKEFIWR